MFLKKFSRKIYYQGSTYKCPFCKKTARLFVPRRSASKVMKERHIVGGGSRKNCYCPWCGSKDRERLVWIFLRDRSDLLKKNIKLLHIAPERKLRNVLQEQKSIEYVSGDKFTEGYAYPENTVNLDLLKLPFKDKLFDWIICNHTLEHIEDDKKAMKEMCRVLKNSGFAVLQAPISYDLEKTEEDSSVVMPKDREKRFGQFDHVRIYGKDYVQRLTSSGFVVNEIIPAESGIDVERYALNPEERVYLVHK